MEGLENIEVSPRKDPWKMPRCHFFLIFWLWLGLLSCHTCGVSGHLGSILNSDGRPNLTPRPIRGRPTVPSMPQEPFYDTSPTIIRLPGLSFGGGGGGRRMYLRNMDDRSFANVNSGVAGASGNEHEGILDYDDKIPTFVPYIGPRALSSMNAYLNHLRENLEALQSSELLADTDDYDSAYSEEGGDEGVDDDFSFNTMMMHPNREKQHSRRDVQEKSLALSLNNGPGLERNRKYVTDVQTSPNPGPLRHRQMASNYHPSWSYTKLGLGKRGTGVYGWYKRRT